ncbi:hypothetical protein EVAR_27972_1 [Eumeta japonica]|uniref:Uncharacterized protein n=1 Tax=Eumeta variegata TaxID=151549 RepID=A0A4C1WB33_EUMVA|nr:hypothetical protein EVAR_27972_1 [Eumeta japonica]
MPLARRQQTAAKSARLRPKSNLCGYCAARAAATLFLYSRMSRIWRSVTQQVGKLTSARKRLRVYAAPRCPTARPCDCGRFIRGTDTGMFYQRGFHGPIAGGQRPPRIIALHEARRRLPGRLPPLFRVLSDFNYGRGEISLPTPLNG